LEIFVQNVNNLVDKGMILYYGITNYHFLCALVHKLTYHKNDDAILLIPSRHNDVKELQKNISNSKIFTKVIPYDEIFIRIPKEKISEQEIDKAINQMTEFVSQNFPVTLSDFEERNIFGDHYSIGIFLVKNELSYNFFEEGRGRLSTGDQLLEHIEKMNPIRAAILKKLKLLGNNKSVKNRFGDLDHQKEGYHNTKDIHFSIEDSLKQLSRTEINKLIKIFGGLKQKDLPKNSTLLLTQHYINLNLLTFDEQKLLYQYIIDYYTDNRALVVKIHPSDIHGLYNNWFNDAIILDRSLPSELLPYCTKEGFDIGIAASSTAVFALSEYCKKIICFTQEIEKTFKAINRYYVALKFLETTNQNIDSVYLLGVNKEQIEILAQLNKIPIKNFIKLDSKKSLNNLKNSVLLIDDYYFENINYPRKVFSKIIKQTKNTIIYLNAKNQNLCFNNNSEDFGNKIIPITINKEVTKVETNSQLQKKEIIYILTDKKKTKDLAKNLEIVKFLPNTGLKIIVNQKENYEAKVLQSNILAIETNIKEIASKYILVKNENNRIIKIIKKIKHSRSWKYTKPLREIKKKLLNNNSNSK
jgi:hypothetical protein